MTNVFEMNGVTKRFKKKVALDNVSLSVPPQSIIGLVGRNGSGKTTLLRHVTGLYLPTSGECTTLGTLTAKLGPKELSQIGMVNQHDSFIDWMTVEKLIRYVSTFYDNWDRELEASLITMLEMDPQARVGTLSPGNLQKVGLVLATCHHPSLLLLDEPLSDLDPIARSRAVTMLLDRFSDDQLTMVISSHMLHDVERIVDRIVCLDSGRIVADEMLDALMERYAEWIVTSASSSLPLRYHEAYVIDAQGDQRQARLAVRHSADSLAEFSARYDATVEVRRLNLEKIFPLIVGTSDTSTELARSLESLAAEGTG